MHQHDESSTDSETTGFRKIGQQLESSTGMPLGEIGSGRPLTASTALAAMAPAETDARLEASLTRLVGSPVAFTTRNLFPANGPIRTVIEGLRWSCPASLADEASRLVAGAFRSAPGPLLVERLHRLRLTTRHRSDLNRDDHEAELTILVEELRRFPGDIVLDVIANWPKRQNGQWWPALSELIAEIEPKMERRMALANYLRRMTTAALPKPDANGLSAEDRARIVEKWERERRPAMVEPEPRGKPAETPEQALARLASDRTPIIIGEEMAGKLASMGDA